MKIESMFKVWFGLTCIVGAVAVAVVLWQDLVTVILGTIPWLIFFIGVVSLMLGVSRN